jgi:hypothetical protein
MRTPSGIYNRISEKIKPRIKSLEKELATGLLSGTLLIAGCNANANKKNEIFNPDTTYTKPYFKLDLEAVNYKVKELGDKIQTTPPHPKDTGWVKQPTKTNLVGKSAGGFAFKTGGGLGYYNSDLGLSLFGGGDIRILGLSSEFRDGLYDNLQHTTDSRPPQIGSFVFTQLNPSVLTYIPKIGIEKGTKNAAIGFEYGFPYMTWEARSGHDRWSSWENVQSEKWRGFGTRWEVKLRYQEKDSNNYGFFSVFGENYKMKFAGENAKVGGLGVSFGVICLF